MRALAIAATALAIVGTVATFPTKTVTQQIPDRMPHCSETVRQDCYVITETGDLYVR